ncbi:hypothetical protein GPJ56_004025 [Histomonas meleagridis]|uniref:uncharacterized protein n=1 Tax=Histomonas meleagridis TaxID=135588 RepID=UPI00355AA4B7|nr:hypothetical protein GPJ56_004025 [Histomonas meleagridis]KAH0796696.1 hypothetical protein GO595_010589 [Histomonas meleagridis]
MTCPFFNTVHTVAERVTAQPFTIWNENKFKVQCVVCQSIDLNEDGYDDILKTDVEPPAKDFFGLLKKYSQSFPSLAEENSFSDLGSKVGSFSSLKSATLKQFGSAASKTEKIPSIFSFANVAQQPSYDYMNPIAFIPSNQTIEEIGKDLLSDIGAPSVFA